MEVLPNKRLDILIRTFSRTFCPGAGAPWIASLSGHLSGHFVRIGRILSAADGDEALALEALHEGPIDLVLTDVVLPGMTGKQLAERLKALRPAARVLYTSGDPEM